MNQIGIDLYCLKCSACISYPAALIVYYMAFLVPYLMANVTFFLAVRV